MTTSQGDMPDRLDRTRAWMAGHDIDTLFVYCYRSSLTAHWTGYCPRHSVTNASLIVITPGNAVHITRLPLHSATAERESTAITQICAARSNWASADTSDMIDVALGWLGSQVAGPRNAFAAYRPEAGVKEELAQRLPGGLVDVTSLLTEHLAPKDPGEIARLRVAARCAQEAFDAGIAAMKAGGVGNDALRAAEAVLRDYGSLTWHCFVGATDAQGRSLLQPSKSILTPGTTVFFEVIPDVESFCPEVVSSVFIVEPPPRAAELDALMARSLDGLLATITPATTFADVFTSVVSDLESAGLSRDDITRLGHGTGIDNIELPEYISETDNRALGVNRVISVHPNIGTEQFGTILRGGTIIVTDTGAERLFSLPDGPLVAG
ncbi:MAG: M24 family metallopeptidase [Streptosporangiaceae bacterium]